MKQKVSTYFLSRSLFIRFLSLIYFSSFVSLSVQILGLIGSNGIAPASSFLNRLSSQSFFQKILFHPTVFWLNTSDPFLLGVCYLGVVLSVFLLIGIMPRFILFLLWFFYLSFVNINREFMSHPWEGLLLETGFLAIFFAPQGLWPIRKQEEDPTSRIFLLLLLWLLFRLMFASSWARLVGGGSSWRDMTSLAYHYETQPLPTWISWYASQLPVWFQKACLASAFAIEPFAPFFIFLWRKLRLKSFLAFVGIQILVIAVGNYSILNWLTLALCILLLDDQTIAHFVPEKLLPKTFLDPKKRPKGSRLLSQEKGARLLLVLLLFSLSSFKMIQKFSGKIAIPTFLQTVIQVADGFKLVNQYELRAPKQPVRREIIIEGSNDLQFWTPYEFKWKPGDLKSAPSFVAPHQPRLDWQMWAAAQGTYEKTPWMKSLLFRLLQGKREVLSLIQPSPFASPPKYIRAVVYQYHFTDFKTRSDWGTWWTREFEKPYTPPFLSLSDFQSYSP